MPAVHGGDSHPECAARQKVRALSVQLPVDLQDFVTENRLSADHLQAYHKSGAESRDAAGAHGAGHVQGDLRTLQRYVLGE